MKHLVLASALALVATSSAMADVVNRANAETTSARKVAKFITCTDSGKGLYRDANESLYLGEPRPHCRTKAPLPPR